MHICRARRAMHARRATYRVPLFGACKSWDIQLIKSPFAASIFRIVEDMKRIDLLASICGIFPKKQFSAILFSLGASQ